MFNFCFSGRCIKLRSPVVMAKLGPMPVYAQKVDKQSYNSAKMAYITVKMALLGLVLV